MRRAARFRLPLELAIASAGMATACTAPPTEPRDRRTDAAADEPASAPETRTPTAAAEGAERVGSTPAAARLASCLRVTPLIAEIACVLPSGLAIGVDGTASRVGDDGELTRVARLPDGARCPLLAHDPGSER